MVDDQWDQGYAKTPLLQKLGVKPDLRIVVLGAPEGFVVRGLGPLPEGTTVGERLDGPADLAISFVDAQATLERQLPALAAATAPDGAFWVAWPKRASKVPTDVTEDRIRELVLPRGLVDVKVCAISPIWSGLKICLRRELR
jgi:hypothetical protein